MIQQSVGPKGVKISLHSFRHMTSRQHILEYSTVKYFVCFESHCFKNYLQFFKLPLGLRFLFKSEKFALKFYHICSVCLFYQPPARILGLVIFILGCKCQQNL